MKNKVLVIAVHPDDETLGCGGTLLKHKANGDEIHWLICTHTNINDDFYKIREKEIKKVTNLYDFNSVHNLKFNSTQIDQYSTNELIEKISNVIKNIEPNILYMPYKNDVHSDHRKIFEASFSCTKPFRFPYIKKIYMMEVVSETEYVPATKEDWFVPNVYVDISKFMKKKIKIMQTYKSELGKHPFPRSKKNLKALSSFRGATVGCKYAESFVLLRDIR